jgi:hypothetical protein
VKPCAGRSGVKVGLQNDGVSLSRLTKSGAVASKLLEVDGERHNVVCEALQCLFAQKCGARDPLLTECLELHGALGPYSSAFAISAEIMRSPM